MGQSGGFGGRKRTVSPSGTNRRGPRWGKTAGGGNGGSGAAPGAILQNCFACSKFLNRQRCVVGSNRHMGAQHSHLSPPTAKGVQERHCLERR